MNYQFTTYWLADRRFIENQRQTLSMFLHANLGGIQQALRVGRAMLAGSRDVKIANLAGYLARKGELAEALKLAESLETAEQRLMVYDLVAIAIRDGRTRQWARFSRLAPSGYHGIALCD